MNKTIIITGGASGIGKATALLFAAQNYTVYVLDKKLLKNNNPNLKFIRCNVANFQQVKTAIQKIHAKEKSIDTVFANAGIHLQANIEATSLKALDDIIAVNLKGIFHTLKATLPIMRKQKQGGNIVVMGSDQSLVAKPENAIYGATKAAIAALAKSAALDYAKYNIRVNCVCPGATLTPLVTKAMQQIAQKTGVSYQKMYAILAKDRPLGRFGKPEEIAELVYFLCSDKAEFITGSVISIDGGYTAQ